MSKICVLGEDERSTCLRKMYLDENVNLEHFSKADFVICPIPFTRDNYYINSENIKIDELIFSLKKNTKSVLITGGLTKEIENKLKLNKVEYYDLLKSENFARNNAVATAEGTLKIIMDITNRTIANMKIAVIGYGKIGSYLTKILDSLNAKVKVVTTSDEKLENLKKQGINACLSSDIAIAANESDIIVNTAPRIMLNKKVLEKLSNDKVIIDIASKPGGVDFVEAEELGIRTLWELGIPQKYSPNSAAEYIKNEVYEIIKNEGKK